MPCWHYMSKMNKALPADTKLKADIDVSRYIAGLVENYIVERTLWAGRVNSHKEYIVTAKYRGARHWILHYEMSCIMKCCFSRPRGGYNCQLGRWRGSSCCNKAPKGCIGLDGNDGNAKNLAGKGGLALVDEKTNVVFIKNRRKKGTVKVEISVGTKIMRVKQ